MRTPHWKKPGNYAIPAAIIIALLVLVSGLHTHDESRFLQELENSSHSILFGLTAIALLRDRNGRPRSYVVAATAAFALGIGVELMQWLMGSDAEVMDAVRDISGIAAFLGISWAFQHVIPFRMRILIVLVGIAIMLTVFWPPILTASAIAYRWHRFPLIADFESPVETRLCSAGDARFYRISLADGHAGRIEFQQNALYSGFTIMGPFPDWSGYQNLTFIVDSGERDLVHLNLRIHDAQHNNDYGDRFNSELHIHPGRNWIKLPLHSIEISPAKRHMDMASIRAIGLFTIRPEKDFALTIDDLKLEKK